MSANINQNGKVTSLMTVGPAWHGLGQVVTEAQTSEEAIKLAHLDYEVTKAPHVIAYEKDNETHGIETVNNYGIYRTDTMKSLTNNGKAVTAEYEIVQNVKAFEFIDNIIQSKQAVFQTAGALGYGETVFVTAKLPEGIIIGEDDPIEQFLLIALNHDGTSSIKIKYTPVRVVCENTLSAALQGKALYTFRHSSNVHDKMKAAEEIILAANRRRLTLQETLNAMANKKISSNSEVFEYIERLFLTNAQAEFFHNEKINLLHSPDVDKIASVDVSTKKFNIMSNIAVSTFNGVGQDLITTKGTVFGLYNGVTTYVSNSKSYSDYEKRFDTIINGTSNSLLDKAYNQALLML